MDTAESRNVTCGGTVFHLLFDSNV